MSGNASHTSFGSLRTVLTLEPAQNRRDDLVRVGRDIDADDTLVDAGRLERRELAVEQCRRHEMIVPPAGPSHSSPDFRRRSTLSNRI
jgi:hypothetical protein